MATRRWKITNLTQGTVELGDGQGALGVGASIFLRNSPSDHLRFLWGANKILIAEVEDKSSSTTVSTETARVEAGESMPQRNKKNRS